MADPQAETVYAWERSWSLWAGAHLTTAECEKLSAKAARRYGIPPPTCVFPDRNRKGGKKQPSTYTSLNHRIHLRPRHRDKVSVLHETAHAITDYVLGDNLEDHGRHWLSIFMNLLIYYKIMPVEALEASARAKGLDWIPLDQTTPKRLRGSFPGLVKAQQDRLRPLKALNLYP